MFIIQVEEVAVLLEISMQLGSSSLPNSTHDADEASWCAVYRTALESVDSEEEDENGLDDMGTDEHTFEWTLRWRAALEAMQTTASDALPLLCSLQLQATGNVVARFQNELIGMLSAGIAFCCHFYRMQLAVYILIFQPGALTTRHACLQWLNRVQFLSHWLPRDQRTIDFQIDHYDCVAKFFLHTCVLMFILLQLCGNYGCRVSLAALRCVPLLPVLVASIGLLSIGWHDIRHAPCCPAHPAILIMTLLQSARLLWSGPVSSWTPWHSTRAILLARQTPR
jgi:hypothetical protein